MCFKEHFSPVSVTPREGVLTGTQCILQQCACVHNQYLCSYMCENEGIVKERKLFFKGLSDLL